MSDNTKIEWTDATWNPITGCSVISAGCKNCYAMELAGTRLKSHPSRTGLTKEVNGHPVWTGEVRFNADWLDQPLRWKKPRRIFVCAHADLFHENVPDEWIRAVFGVMSLCPQHTFQVLTKRPERMKNWLAGLGENPLVYRYTDPGFARISSMFPDGYPKTSWPLPNVWLGVSVEDQAAADARIPILLDTPAAVRWISAEPLLGPVNLGCIAAQHPHAYGYAIGTWDPLGGSWWPACGDFDEEYRNRIEDTPRLDWVVVGGESGPNARPMHPDWVRALRDQCQAAGVPFMFKQWGEWAPRSACYHTFDDGKSLADYDPSATKWPCRRVTEKGNDGRDLAHAVEGDHAYMQRVGKKTAGRLLDGVEWNQYPEAPR